FMLVLDDCYALYNRSLSLSENRSEASVWLTVEALRGAEKNKLRRSKLPGIRLIEITHSVVTSRVSRGSSPNIPWIPAKSMRAWLYRSCRQFWAHDRFGIHKRDRGRSGVRRQFYRHLGRLRRWILRSFAWQIVTRKTRQSDSSHQRRKYHGWTGAWEKELLASLYRTGA